MHKGRMEAFSDGVIAIILTIMALELRPPHGFDWAALCTLTPKFLAYALSFILIAIYWNNHHHLLQATKHVNGRVLWANMHLLFWLSLIPFVTAWMGENYNHEWPVAIYSVVMLLSGFAYFLLTRALLAAHPKDSVLARAIGNDLKGMLSLGAYIGATTAAFYSIPVSYGLILAVAILWLIPDRRIEKALGN